MAGAYKERCSRGKPCIFCGDIGLDMRVIYSPGGIDEEIVHWCRKTSATKGEVVSVGGEDYICIAADHETADSTMGTFNLFKKYLTKEEWIEKQKRLNPDWTPSSKGTGKPFVRREISFENTRESDELIEGEERALSHEELDKRHRALLTMLVLEDKHRNALLKEWDSPVYKVEGLIDRYLIRSLPPTDKARYHSPYKYKGPSRKKIIETLWKMFGDLKGIPGLYERGGSYWAEKPEWERWTIAFPNEGVIFPCFDADGYIYRLRIKDEMPDLEVKEGKMDAYQGMYGYFHRFIDREGYLSCEFVSKDGEKKTVKPTEAYGKARGKYKNFSSVVEKFANGKIVNMFNHGTRSGSPVSLYVQPDDNYMQCILTEGEKKAMVANACKRIPCVSIPGVSAYNLIFKSGIFDHLVEKGCKYFILCYDADKDENESVLKAEQAFVKALKEKGVTVFIGSWKHEYEKGLDDVLLQGLEIEVEPA